MSLNHLAITPEVFPQLRFFSPSTMPYTLFNWRPKIQLQLKRLPLLNRGSGEEEDGDEDQRELDDTGRMPRQMDINAELLSRHDGHIVNSTPPLTDWSSRYFASPPMFVPAHTTQIDRRSLSTPSRLSPTKLKSSLSSEMGGKPKMVRFDDESTGTARLLWGSGLLQTSRLLGHLSSYDL